jgi:hypothetical protein
VRSISSRHGLQKSSFGEKNLCFLISPQRAQKRLSLGMEKDGASNLFNVFFLSV